MSGTMQTFDIESIQELTRRQIRYLLFRLGTQEEGGSGLQDCAIAAAVVKDHFEQSIWLQRMGGFREFGSKWDVNEDEGLTIIPLDMPLVERWHSDIEGNVKDLPNASDL